MGPTGLNVVVFCPDKIPTSVPAVQAVVEYIVTRSKKVWALHRATNKAINNISKFWKKMRTFQTKKEKKKEKKKRSAGFVRSRPPLHPESSKHAIPINTRCQYR